MQVSNDFQKVFFHHKSNPCLPATAQHVAFSSDVALGVFAELGLAHLHTF